MLMYNKIKWMCHHDPDLDPDLDPDPKAIHGNCVARSNVAQIRVKK